MVDEQMFYIHICWAEMVELYRKKKEKYCFVTAASVETLLQNDIYTPVGD